MSIKTRAFDWRKKHFCFVCEEEIKRDDKKFLVAIEGFHRPINLYVHRGCYDEKKIKQLIKNDEKRPTIISDSI